MKFQGRIASLIRRTIMLCMLLRPRFQPSIVVALVALAFAVTSCAQESPAAAPVAAPVGNQDHRATLNWAPSPDAKKAGGKLNYAVYRSDGTRKPDGTPQCIGTFDKIAEVEGSKTTFIDHAVKADRVYCYKLRSVTGKTEGPPTAIVIAIIPPPDKSK
jgi:hypothetical protein